MLVRRFDLGDSELVAIQAQPDRVVKTDHLFPSVSACEIEPMAKIYPAFFGETAQDIRLSQTICVIRTNGTNILVDTGIPIHLAEATLADGLTEAGISTSEIGIVVITHRDFDHLGGNLREGRPAFPNARYTIGRTEHHDFAMTTNRKEAYEEFLLPLEDAGVLGVVSDDAEIAPGIRFWLTPGHRRGATSVLIGEKAILVADVFHTPFQVTHPDWKIRFDSDPDLAAQTRELVIDRAEREKLLVAVPHIPGFGIGRIGRREGVRVWLPLT